MFFFLIVCAKFLAWGTERAPRRVSSMMTLAGLAALVSPISAFALVNQNSAAAPAVVRIQGGGGIELNGEPQGSLSDLRRLRAAITRMFPVCVESTKIEPASMRPDNSCREQPIIVQADASLEYGLIADLLSAVRAITIQPIKVKASNDPTDPYAMPPASQHPDARALRPNPLALVVTISADRKLSLNNDEMGDTNDPSRLIQKLSAIFQQRTELNAFRPGTDKIEKTVFVKASRSLPFSEVIQVIDTVKQAGADPTGLQIDDLPK